MTKTLGIDEAVKPIKLSNTITMTKTITASRTHYTCKSRGRLRPPCPALALGILAPDGDAAGGRFAASLRRTIADTRTLTKLIRRIEVQA